MKNGGDEPRLIQLAQCSSWPLAPSERDCTKPQSRHAAAEVISILCGAFLFGKWPRAAGSRLELMPGPMRPMHVGRQAAQEYLEHALILVMYQQVVVTFAVTNIASASLLQQNLRAMELRSWSLSCCSWATLPLLIVQVVGLKRMQNLSWATYVHAE